MEYGTAPLFPNADGTRNKDRGARLVRWTLDLAGATDQIKREQIDDMAGEFPRFDERRAGLSYRHGWFAGDSERSGGFGFDTIAHLDLSTGKRRTHDLPAGDATGEPIFVPRHAGAPEGDGWVISVVYRGAEDRGDFLVFDAQDLPAGPIATAKLPRRVPFGFHGNWRPAA
ncbi:MAG: carotenoid oxygenase family protein [Caulobacteraceae bacterium]